MIVRCSATLRITSNVLSAPDISSRLGAEPTGVVNKGDLVSQRSKKPSYFQHTLWKWHGSIDEKEPLERHLEEILSFLRPRRDQVHGLSNCEIDIFCGVFSDSEQIGFDLSQKIVQDIARYPIDLVFDGYGESSSM